MGNDGCQLTLSRSVKASWRTAWKREIQGLSLKRALQVFAATATDVTLHQEHALTKCRGGQLSGPLPHGCEIQVRKYGFIGAAYKLGQWNLGTGARSQHKRIGGYPWVALAYGTKYE